MPGFTGCIQGVDGPCERARPERTLSQPEMIILSAPSGRLDKSWRCMDFSWEMEGLSGKYIRTAPDGRREERIEGRGKEKRKEKGEKSGPLAVVTG